MDILYQPGIPKLPRQEVLAQLADSVAQRYPDTKGTQLIIADDSHLQMLNRQFRDIDRSTDVLSFSLYTGEETPLAPSIPGEVYISIDRARSQAAEQGVELLEELARLLTHGLLHLAGFEHRNETELHQMEHETNIFLSAAGLLAAPTA